MIPRFDDSTWSSFLDKGQSLIASDSQNLFVVYFFNRVKATGTLKNLEVNINYFPSWYNTRNRMYSKMASFKSTDSNWTIPHKPDSKDWILLVKKKGVP